MALSPALSIVRNAKATLVGRKVGILFAEGSDRAEIAKVKKAATEAGATVMLIAPKVGGIPVKGGTLEADGQLAGTPSVLLDAVAIVLADKAAKKLAKDGAAVQFVQDAFGHLKAIGHNAGARPLLERAGVEPDDGVTDLSAAFVKAAAMRFYDREPNVRDLA
jgi:catalase